MKNSDFFRPKNSKKSKKTRAQKILFRQRTLLVAAKLCSNSSIHSEPKTSITLAGFFRIPSDEMGAKSEKQKPKLGVDPALEECRRNLDFPH